MNTFSFKGMFVTAAFAATASIAFAEPAQTITLMSPTPLQPYAVECLDSLETEWSTPVMVNADTELQVLTKWQESVATAHFVSAGEASSKAVLQLSEPVTTDGIYQISVPAGTVYDGLTYEESMATNANTLIIISVENEGGDVASVKLLSVTPADGSTVTEISHLDTYWDVNGQILGCLETSIIRNAAGEIVSKSDMAWDDFDMEHFTLDFNPVVTEPGVYTVEIPTGALVDDDANGVNEAVTLHYTIAGDEPVNGVKMLKSEPAAGSILASLSSVSTWWDDEEPAFTWVKEAYVANEAGEKVATAYGDYNWFGDANEIVFTLNPVITEKGEYALVIPEGYFESADGSELNAETKIVYTIDPDYAALLTDFEATDVTPADGITVDMNDTSGKSDLSHINVTFPSFPYIKEGYNFVFHNEEGEEIPSTSQIANEMYGNYIILGLPDSIPTGKYTLSIPEGVVGNQEWAESKYEKGRMNPAMEFSWNYIAKDEVALPDWVLNDPLKLELLTMTVDSVEVNLLGEDVALAKIPNGADFAIRTNKDEYAESLLIAVSDNKTGDVVWKVWSNESVDPSIPSVGMKDENGVFHFTKTRDVVFYNDRTYTFKVEAYQKYEVPAADRKFLQSASVILGGLTEPITYSDVDILEVTPDPEEWEIESYDDRTFTIVYDAPVNIITMPASYGDVYTSITNGMYGNVDFEEITSNEDKTEWSFTLPESALATAMGSIIVNIVADDMEGKRVYPEFCEFNKGSDQEVYQQITFTCYLGGDEIDVVPGAGVVPSLYEFTFTAPNAVNGEIYFTGMGAKGAANGILYNEAGEEVARLDRDDIAEYDNGASSDAVINKIVMHLDKEIKEEGKYQLYLQPGAFTTGREYSTLTNLPIRIDYTVSTVSVGEVAAEASIVISNGVVTVNGVEGTVEVYDLAGAKVASVEAVGGSAAITLAKGSYVIVANGKSTVVLI
jgi:hypothetical protein